MFYKFSETFKPSVHDSKKKLYISVKRVMLGEGLAVWKRFGIEVWNCVEDRNNHGRPDGTFMRAHQRQTDTICNVKPVGITAGLVCCCLTDKLKTFIK